MKKHYAALFFISAFILLIYSCSSNDEGYINLSNKNGGTTPGPITLDLSQVPLPKLSDYHFLLEPSKTRLPIIRF